MARVQQALQHQVLDACSMKMSFKGMPSLPKDRSELTRSGGGVVKHGCPDQALQIFFASQPKGGVSFAELPCTGAQ
jgi:hypothetical protein